MSGRLAAVLALALGPMVAEAASPPVTAVAIAPDGKSVVVGSQAGIERRSWPELAPMTGLKTSLASVLDLAFSPDGKTLAAAGGEPAVRGAVELWAWPSGEVLRRFSPHKDVIHGLAWRADSRGIATASLDRRVGLHEITEPGSSRFLEGHSRGVLTVILLPGQARLLSAGIDETIRLWDTESGASLRTLPNHTRPVHQLALRPGSRDDAPALVASVSDDRTVRFWQPTFGRLVRFARLKSAPLAAAWTPDGRTLYVACKDGHLRTIDPDTAEVVDDRRAIEGAAYALAVAGDGSVLVGGQGGQLRRIASVGPDL